jgi:hypothetical protein
VSVSRNWHDITYLAQGNERQRRAYEVLMEVGVLRDLAEFTPVLAGTIPLDLDIEGSDLDILCAAQELGEFQERLIRLYARHEGFRVGQVEINGVRSVIANFSCRGFPFEVFGQPVPVVEQNGYRHMDVEARLLALGGEEAREAIRNLKRQGIKTEPAFARYFQLPGDPYATLAHLATLDEESLRAAIGADPAR